MTALLRNRLKRLETSAGLDREPTVYAMVESDPATGRPCRILLSTADDFRWQEGPIDFDLRRAVVCVHLSMPGMFAAAHGGDFAGSLPPWEETAR